MWSCFWLSCVDWLSWSSCFRRFQTVSFSNEWRDDRGCLLRYFPFTVHDCLGFMYERVRISKQYGHDRVRIALSPAKHVPVCNVLSPGLWNSGRVIPSLLSLRVDKCCYRPHLGWHCFLGRHGCKGKKSLSFKWVQNIGM